MGLGERYQNQIGEYRMNQKTQDLKKLISQNIERCVRKKEIQQKTLKDIENREELRLYGELITANIYSIKEGMTKAELPLGDALYSAFLYGTFQLSNIAVFVQHAKSFDKPGDAVKSMGVGFIVNALMMVMVVLGLMTIYTNPDAAGQSVPTLFMVQNGVGASFMTPLISILIILGAVSTAVNMVAAMVKRICGEAGEEASGAEVQASGEAEEKEKPAGKKRFQVTRKEIIAALICCIIDFGIAQFGLLTLIQKAYSFLAYLAIPVILIPYIIHMIATRFDTKI